MRVVKRDGGLQELQMSKIQRALLMAFEGSSEKPDVMPLVHRVMDRVRGEGDVTVAEVSDACEEVLAEAGWVDVARRYMRHRIEQDRKRAERLTPDSRGLSEYIHVAKYARYQNVVGRREVFSETIDRVEMMHYNRWPELGREIQEAFRFVRRREVMPSMRSMQFGGAAILKNNERIYNCSFTHIDRWRAFQEIFYLLLCGCGAGYSVQWRHVDMLTEIRGVDPGDVLHHTVDDSIEGWADALGVLIECYVKTGQYPEFNYSQIRGAGMPLVTSGGRAPGHLGLKKMLEAVRCVLDGAVGRKLRPLECHDVLCHVAEAVLSGGIRRSSLICLFSPEDTEMLYCKARGNFRPAYGEDPGLNSQRQMANNSAALLRGSVDRQTFDRLIRVAQENYGDPGFYFTNNLDYGPNPCGEIGMWPKVLMCDEHGVGRGDWVCCPAGRIHSGVSFCNLTEVNCQDASSEELLARIKAAAFIGTLQAAYNEFSYLGAATEAIVRREALLGVGLTGIQDNRGVALDPQVQRDGAAVAIAENRRVACLIGTNQAARVTTIKPSGTSSLEMGGVGSGIHPRWSRRYIRRVTANPSEPQAAFFKQHNPHMVETKPNGDWCLMFPIQVPDGALTVREQTALEFVQDVFTTYENWIKPGTALPNSAPGLTHNVSCTVTIRDGELDDVLEVVWENRNRIGAMSFVPYLIDQKFRYAPHQAVRGDESLWNDLIRLYKPIDWLRFNESNDSTQLKSEPACAGGKCEV